MLCCLRSDPMSSIFAIFAIQAVKPIQICVREEEKLAQFELLLSPPWQPGRDSREQSKNELPFCFDPFNILIFYIRSFTCWSPRLVISSWLPQVVSRLSLQGSNIVGVGSAPRRRDRYQIDRIQGGKHERKSPARNEKRLFEHPSVSRNQPVCQVCQSVSLDSCICHRFTGIPGSWQQSSAGQSRPKVSFPVSNQQQSKRVIYSRNNPRYASQDT